MLLSQLMKDRPARVTALDANATSILKRLQHLGFEVGAIVEILHQGFPTKDPIAVRVDDHLVALGRCEADAIEVQEV